MDPSKNKELTPKVHIPEVVELPSPPDLKTEGDGEIKYPIRIYSTGKAVYLSQREELVANCFIETCSFPATIEKLKNEYKRVFDTHEIRNILEKPHVYAYLTEQLHNKGHFKQWEGVKGKYLWARMMDDHLNGIKILSKSDLYLMKMAAPIFGLTYEGPTNQTNIQLNFTQKDGKE